MGRSIASGALLLASLALAACQTSSAPEAPTAAAEPEPESKPVFEPARGVSCDRQTKVCNYKGGATVGLTRIFFGDGAADAIDVQQAAIHYRYDPIFKPNPDESCDTLVTTCYDGSGASEDLTRRYFGSKAAKMLSDRRSQIVRYGKYVTCDRTSQVCYDRLGAGVGVTRLYLGEPQSERLLDRLRATGA